MLKKNPNVKKVSKLAITYTDEFKHKFFDGYSIGKLPRQIFEKHGFDIDVIGIDRVKSCSKDWNRKYKANGFGLTDSRKGYSGRPLQRNLTQDEIIKRQEARIAFLEGQIELLKKLETTEGSLLEKGEKLTACKQFQLIHETNKHYGSNRLVKYFCELLGTSRSGYYIPK